MTETKATECVCEQTREHQEQQPNACYLCQLVCLSTDLSQSLSSEVHLHPVNDLSFVIHFTGSLLLQLHSLSVLISTRLTRWQMFAPSHNDLNIVRRPLCVAAVAVVLVLLCVRVQPHTLCSLRGGVVTTLKTQVKS